jgi:hypothetical protein
MNPNKLKEIRRKNSVTQNMLANLLNVSQQTISCWENGMVIPKPYYMQKMEDYFQVPKEEIFYTLYYQKS